MKDNKIDIIKMPNKFKLFPFPWVYTQTAKDANNMNLLLREEMVIVLN